MKAQTRTSLILVALFAVLMSIPWLVPHMGALALIGIVPLLCLERLAAQGEIKRFFLWVLLAFTLWNSLTIWWVCEATVGGGIFAVLFNALNMSIIWWIFHFSRKKLGGVLPYVFLTALWITFEKAYFNWQISFPWLTFGNAFANTTSLVQWYEYTGIFGGSLWVWLVNLGVFGIMVALSDGRWFGWNRKAQIAAVSGLTLVILAPMICSAVISHKWEERSDAGTLDVVMAQTNFDPYEKFHGYTQAQQNAQALQLFGEAMQDRISPSEYPSEALLMMVPETFSSDVCLNHVATSPTWRSFHKFMADCPNTNLLLGASTYDVVYAHSKPSIIARPYGDDGWYRSHNSALMTDSTRREDVYHKSKLVVGTELLPYPKIFLGLDNALGGVMGRCEGQPEISVLDVHEYSAEGTLTRTVPVGVAICYESIFSEYPTGYVNKGAQFIAVITNDGWWGNTPGYRQHFSYSRLRAIELRRDVARCANTGISAFINQKGDVLQQSGWWVPDALRGTVNLTTYKTYFAQHGDIIGRLCTFVCALLLLVLITRLFIKKNE